MHQFMRRAHFFFFAVLVCLSACDGTIISGNPELIQAEQDEQHQQLLLSLKETLHRQYPIVRSSDPLHWAIDGRGYFILEDPQNGQQFYTRNGRFVSDNNHYVSSASGFRLVPNLRVENPAELTVRDNGEVLLKGRELARLKLAIFEDATRLESLDNSGETGVFRLTRESGKPAVLEPLFHDSLSDVSTGLIVQSALEDFSDSVQAIPERGCKQPQLAQLSPQVWDLSIQGEGFFQILDPRSGELFFTREGNFERASGGELEAGTLSYGERYVLEPRIVIPDGQVLERVDAQGRFFFQGETEPRGQIQLARFTQPERLVPLGFTRGAIYRRLSGSGYREALPGQEGLGTLRDGQIAPCAAAVF